MKPLPVARREGRRMTDTKWTPEKRAERNRQRAELRAALTGLVADLTREDIVDRTFPPAPTYLDIHDELQARVNDLNRTLVRCWDVPACRRTTLITWTSLDSTHAPVFILRPKP